MYCFKYIRVYQFPCIAYYSIRKEIIMKIYSKNKALFLSTMIGLIVCLACIMVLLLKTNQLNRLSSEVTALSTQVQSVEENNNILLKNKIAIKEDFLSWEEDFVQKNPYSHRMVMEIEKYEALAQKAREVLENE